MKEIGRIEGTGEEGRYEGEGRGATKEKFILSKKKIFFLLKANSANQNAE